MIILFRENVIQTYLCAKVCTLCQPWHRELQIKHVWIFVLSSLKDGLNSDTLEVFFSTNGGLRSGWSISGLKSTLSHWFFWAIQRWTWCCVSDHCPAIWVLWPSHHDLMVRHHPCGFSGAEQNSQLHQLQRVALVQPESAKLKSESPTRNTDVFKQSVWWT